MKNLNYYDFLKKYPEIIPLKVTNISLLIDYMKKMNKMIKIDKIKLSNLIFDLKMSNSFKDNLNINIENEMVIMILNTEKMKYFEANDIYELKAYFNISYVEKDHYFLNDDEFSNLKRCLLIDEIYEKNY